MRLGLAASATLIVVALLPIAAALLIVSAALSTTLLIVSATLSSALLGIVGAGAIVYREKRRDCIFNLRRACRGERSVAELEYYFRFLERGRAGVVTGVARDQIERDLIFRQIHRDL